MHFLKKTFFLSGAKQEVQSSVFLSNIFKYIPRNGSMKRSDVSDGRSLVRVVLQTPRAEQHRRRALSLTPPSLLRPYCLLRQEYHLNTHPAVTRVIIEVYPLPCVLQVSVLVLIY
jgi:hypothetical protein